MHKAALDVEVLTICCCANSMPELDMNAFSITVFALVALHASASALASDRGAYPMPNSGSGKGRIAAGVIWSPINPFMTPTVAYPHRWGEIKDSRGISPSLKDIPYWTIDLNPPGYVSRINKPRTAAQPAATRTGLSGRGVAPTGMALPNGAHIERERSSDGPHDFTWKQGPGTRDVSPPQSDLLPRLRPGALGTPHGTP